MLCKILFTTAAAVTILTSGAKAADYFQFPDSLYPKPTLGLSSPGPAQVDYNNSFIDVTQFTVLRNAAGAPIGGTRSDSAFVRTADLIASSPAVVSLQQRIDASMQQLQNVTAQTQQLQNITAQLQQTVIQTERGVAAVAAMANISMPSAPGRTSWAVNGAAFLGEVGGGLSFAHRLNTSVPIAVTAAYGNGGGSAHVGRVGLMGEF
jgi:trimeric autotransporter adhesin